MDELEIVLRTLENLVNNMSSRWWPVPRTILEQQIIYSLVDSWRRLAAIKDKYAQETTVLPDAPKDLIRRLM